MSDVVSVYDAKAQLSKLLGRVELGEEIVISRHGRPVARLVPLAPVAPVRKPGRLAGRGIVVPDDFEEFTEQDEREEFTEQDERDWYGE